MQLISELRNKYLNPSLNDLLSLLLAKRDSCFLITGDNALRNAAKHEGVIAHGLLWLFDEMVSENILKGIRQLMLWKELLQRAAGWPKENAMNA